ncbi:hypothetical protein BA190_16460 [Labrys sp. WJW]|uniref:hypothetical protein n=1 Tax=Labrys sp. WJW TaxID=1737983 RepID=UPI000835DF2A|nr:hypothetical protein [Labrys sp. WJW]OCC03841.1 hypothetical protein BA190_16460 [Labrys sp. WJW]
MRVLLSVALLANLAAGCSYGTASTETIRPFTGNVPRIPGNYAAEAKLQKPAKGLPLIGVTSTSEHPNASTDYQACVAGATRHEVNNVAGVEACNGAYGYLR